MCRGWRLLSFRTLKMPMANETVSPRENERLPAAERKRIAKEHKAKQKEAEKAAKVRKYRKSLRKRKTKTFVSISG